MANKMNKNHILEAIDKLRMRKSRPDALRIVSYVSRKYDFPKSDIKNYLNMLCKDGTVLKVEFKGSISYRNPAYQRKVSAKSVSRATQDESSSCEYIGNLVTGALARLIVEEPDCLDVGVSMNKLYDHTCDKIKKPIRKAYFKEVLEKEVKKGNLMKFENGNYCLGYPSGENNTFSRSVSNAPQNLSDTRYEKSKNSIHPIQKHSSLSRVSSRSSKKHSSSLEKTYITLQKTYARKKVKEIERVEEIDNNEVYSSRESRRKRFQKIVFDPSESPKPKKLKGQKASVVTPSAKLRGLYKKQYKKTKSSQAKITKKAPLPGSRLLTRSSTLESKQEQSKPKEDPAATDEDSSVSRRNCRICGISIDFKSSKSTERWTSCHFCGKRAHVTCIENAEQWTKFNLSKWLCNDCKSCVACQKKKKEAGNSKLILCILCEDAYHRSCANVKKFTDKWLCDKCSVFKDGSLKSGNENEKEEFLEVTLSESPRRTTPELEEKETPTKEEEEDEMKPNTRQKEQKEKEKEEVDPQEDVDESIPDCSDWSCEEVYSYFTKYVLPEEARVFRDEEIDGKVLLLLTRYDVLSDFKLNLGPALKIYAQVKKLQVRKNDLYLIWP